MDRHVSGTGNGLANIISGGSGNDSLNGGAGNDRIIGGAGNDAMNGGTGNDVFAFIADFGNDTITGFDANPTGGQDLLDVRPFGISAADFASRVSIVDLGADTQVTIADGGIITLFGVNGTGANVVTVSDFLLN